MIGTYYVSLGYLMILGHPWFSLVFLGFPDRFKALVSYKPDLMAVAWLYTVYSNESPKTCTKLLRHGSRKLDGRLLPIKGPC